MTHDWWDQQRARFELYTSRLALQEAKAGDTIAAQERLDVLAKMAVLETTPAAETLAQQIVAGGALPNKALADALHIAVATTQGIDYLLTWNCKHLANAAMRKQIEAVCEVAGFETPIICTPAELEG